MYIFSSMTYSGYWKNIFLADIGGLKKIFLEVIAGSLYTTEARVMIYIAADGKSFNEKIIPKFSVVHREHTMVDSLTEIVHFLLLE